MSRLLYFFVIVLLCCISCADPNTTDQDASADTLDTTIVKLWNGNRTVARQIYEKQILEAALTKTESEYGPWAIVENLDEHPGPQEALVFNTHNHDLFVTIAGNRNFGPDDKILVPQPITRGLLGYRIPIIREEDSSIFNSISKPDDIKKLKHGIPTTWSDADIFRHNGYSVVEEGAFEDIFQRLATGQFDYAAYGANEVLGVMQNRASLHEGLTIDGNVILFYPFPLVFYVNPELPNLAKRVEDGLDGIIEDGIFDAIFNEHYGDIVNQLNLDKRKVFMLDNHILSEEYMDMKPDLID